VGQWGGSQKQIFLAADLEPSPWGADLIVDLRRANSLPQIWEGGGYKAACR